MRSLEARSFNNWPIIKLSIKTKIMALNTNVLPNNVVRIITVIKAPIPNDGIDLFHKIIPGIVANKHRINPSTGNTYVTKATITSAIVPIIVALGCTLKTHSPPYTILTITSILTSKQN